MFYLKELAEKQNRKYADVFKESKGKWQQLPPTEQQKYKDLYMEAFKKYTSDLEEWKQKMIREGNEQLVDIKLMHRTRRGSDGPAKERKPRKKRTTSKKSAEGEPAETE